MIGIRAYVEQGNLGHADITAAGDISVSKLSGTAGGFVYGIEAINRGTGNSLIKYSEGTLNVTNSVGVGATGFGLSLMVQRRKCISHHGGEYVHQYCG